MKIYNESKTEILNMSDCDLENGYFTEEEIIVGERPSLKEQKQNENGSVTTVVHQNLEVRERILIYKVRTSREKNERAIYELENWFENEYREKYEKFTRKIAMNMLLKDGSDPKIKLNQLFLTAETKANQISELKKLLT